MSITSVATNTIAALPSDTTRAAPILLGFRQMVTGRGVSASAPNAPSGK